MPWRRGRVLVWAAIVSLIVHLLGGSGAADWLAHLYESDPIDPGQPLRTVLRPPPPPVFQPAPRPPPPKKKPRPRPHVAPPVLTTPESSAEALPPMAEASPSEARVETPPEPAPQPERSVAEAPVPVAEPAPEPEPEPAPVPAPIRVPKRIDLVGTAFIGAQNFMVGTGGFSLRHDGNRYEISVLGKARGLARLMVSAGEFSGVSRGAITPLGLQPSEYSEERGGPEKRETATLDWETGVVHLQGDKIVPIEPPLYDRLSVIMQFYYRPPEATELSMRVTGTRYVDTYVFKRQPDEMLELALGTVNAHRWRADYDDGGPRLEIWMSPEYHYLPLKVRIHAQQKHGGRFATLTIDEIRVQD
ncbi:MAG: DUF3108 domain-containing protein [Betaproteobacteria bacterium]